MTRGLAASIAIAASVGAGLVHFALGPEHIEELGALGWGFYVAAMLQVGVAAALFAVRGEVRVRQVAFTGIAINLAILGAWLVARTVGLPAGETPWVPESIGRVDTITAALEVAIVIALVAELRIHAAAAAPRARSPRMASVLAVLVIAAGTAAALAPDAAHAEGHDAMGEAMHHEAMPEVDSAP